MYKSISIKAIENTSKQMQIELTQIFNKLKYICSTFKISFYNVMDGNIYGFVIDTSSSFSFDAVTTINQFVNRQKAEDVDNFAGELVGFKWEYNNSNYILFIFGKDETEQIESAKQLAIWINEYLPAWFICCGI